MKIVSNFKDYYDSIVAYGTDPMIMYKRFTTIKPWNINKQVNINDRTTFWSRYPIQPTINRDFYDISVENFYVFFCGQLFVGWKVSKTINQLTTNDIFYKVEDIIKFFSDFKNPHAQLSYHSTDDFPKYITEKFNLIYQDSLQSNYNTEWHIENAAPVLIIRTRKKIAELVINPKLKDFNFQKVKEPFTAFQEISAYLSNTFGYPGNEIVEVSEKTKIQKHGYDKWSFRKKGINSK